MEQHAYDVTKEDTALSLLDILVQRVHLSTRHIRRLKQERAILLNGHPVSVNAKPRAGDQITFVPEPEDVYFEPQYIPLHVIYEDEDLLVVNKDPYLVVHPTKGHPDMTLTNGVVYYAREKGEFYKPRLINRLDRDTSGLVVLAKNPHTQHIISQDMREDKVQKTYLAVVHGQIKSEGTVDLPIEREEEGSMRRIVREDGKPCVTHFKVIKRLKNASVLTIRLETGRTHQIRVHMAHLGHPIIGDRLYGSFEDVLIARQALHAIGLTMETVKRQPLILEAPLPKDIEHLIAFLDEMQNS